MVSQHLSTNALRILILLGLMIFGTAGCGDLGHSADEAQDPDRMAPINEGNQMAEASFVINGTEFGIDVVESSFVVDTSDPPEQLVTIEIRGDKDIFEKLSGDENSEWSWALYPPHFYIREFPGEKVAGSPKVVAGGSADYYELAIYMMEHNDVSDLKIEIDPQKTLHVTGRVDVFGETHDFEIRWQK